jgi:SNF2 family DNA or RNA helicase
VARAHRYETALSDSAVLHGVRWRGLIVDEGHRLKNAASRLHRTLVREYAPRRRGAAHAAGS